MSEEGEASPEPSLVEKKEVKLSPITKEEVKAVEQEPSVRSMVPYNNEVEIVVAVPENKRAEV
jgi:hypothetical protein